MTTQNETRLIMQDFYEITVECSNCDHVGLASLPFGVLAPKNIFCPNCGCEEARKVKIDKPQLSKEGNRLIRDNTCQSQVSLSNPFQPTLLSH